MIRYFFILTIIFSSSLLKAQISTPTYSNEFLNIGVGARSFGMGKACISSQDNVEAAYWNPSLLSNIKKEYDVSFMHSEFFAGMSAYDYLGFATRIDNNNVCAFSFIRYGVDDIPNTLELIDENGNFRYDRITSFSAADYAFLFSLSHKTKIPNLSLGGSVKLIYRHTGDFASAYGFGLDVSASYKLNKWNVSAVLRDAVGTFNAWVFDTELLEKVFEETNNDIPENSVELTVPRLILGVSRVFPIGKKFSLLTEVNADILFDGQRNTLLSSGVINIDPHVGIEAAYKDFIFLRAGIGRIQREKDFNNKENIILQPNLGLGVNYKGFSLSYALTDVGNQSIALYSNIFSFTYSFDSFKNVF